MDNCTWEWFVNFSSPFEPFKVLKMDKKPFNFYSCILELNNQIFVGEINWINLLHAIKLADGMVNCITKATIGKKMASNFTALVFQVKKWDLAVMLKTDELHALEQSQVGFVLFGFSLIFMKLMTVSFFILCFRFTRSVHVHFCSTELRELH